MPIWAWVLICVGCLVIGVFIGILWLARGVMEGFGRGLGW